MDGVSEKISNYMVEPPGIFRGRGTHPLIGKLKGRILPENVSINIGPDNPVPICSIPGHCWDKIVQSNEATWLAYYKDVNNKKSKKYVFLSASSKLKGQNDLKKYEKARKLKDQIEKIRQDYSKKLVDSVEEKRQLGVATYLIDKLALRVGNEKADDEADTVGCCSLRVEHIKIEEESKVTFDFLGKDSMRYFNTVEVDPKIHENIKKFVKGKDKKDDLFDLINASKLNDYLKSLMDGLSAKVFRTFNASITLQKELDKCTLKETEDIDAKVAFYNEANKQVAILCNHQKTLSKNFNVQSEKLQAQLKDHLDYLKELQIHVKTFTQGKNSRKNEKLEKIQSENSENKSKIKKVFPDDLEKTENLIQTLKKKIERLEYTIRNKEETKEIALGTSKLNYMDPRITVAWCKTFEVPIERVFTKSVRDKFPWAMYIQPSYKF
jgi:DNA topoisomerase-1